MAIEKYWLGAYWGNRKESLEQCAHRAADLFQRISPFHPALKQWRKPGTLRGRANSEFNPTFENLRTELGKGRNRRDIDQAIIDDLGFLVSIFNAAPGFEDLMVNIHCGAYPNVMDTPNFILMKFPKCEPAVDLLVHRAMLSKFVVALVTSWDPDRARVSTDQLLDHLKEPEDLVGWLTYFSDRCGTFPPLPPGYQVERIGERGTLVTIQMRGRFTASNPEHVGAVRLLSQILRKAGLLEPKKTK